MAALVRGGAAGGAGARNVLLSRWRRQKEMVHVCNNASVSLRRCSPAELQCASPACMNEQR